IHHRAGARRGGLRHRPGTRQRTRHRLGLHHPASVMPGLAPSKELPPAEERGRLTIAPGALRAIVEAASTEVEGVISEAQPGLIPAGRPSRAQVRLDGDTAAVRLRVTLHYPQSIPDVLTRLRTHVVDRVDQLAAITVHACDIEVGALTLAPGEQEIG